MHNKTKQFLQDFTTDVRREDLQIKRGKLPFPPQIYHFSSLIFSKITLSAGQKTKSSV